MNLFKKILSWKNFPNGINYKKQYPSIIMCKVCPVCIKKPIENLPVLEYIEKYPANIKINIGYENIWICEKHLKELGECIKEIIDKNFEEVNK